MVLPEIRLLQAAIALAEELNFSRAAARLRIEQSTLSKRIVELESQIDLRLFVRNHQTVELTEAGRHFVEDARRAVLYAERAVADARAAMLEPTKCSTLAGLFMPIRIWSRRSSRFVFLCFPT
jgi:DNA-binding transcriptional LysR family regulator